LRILFPPRRRSPGAGKNEPPKISFKRAAAICQYDLCGVLSSVRTDAAQEMTDWQSAFSVVCCSTCVSRSQELSSAKFWKINENYLFILGSYGRSPESHFDNTDLLVGALIRKSRVIRVEAARFCIWCRKCSLAHENFGEAVYRRVCAAVFRGRRTGVLVVWTLKRHLESPRCHFQQAFHGGW
jgi:hypothetical protein